MLLSPLRRLRRRVRALLHEDVFVSVGRRVELERHGSTYGGWSIERNSLSASDVVYSFGVGDDVSFDLSIIDRYGVAVHAFDPTPRSVAWVRRQALPAQFRFHEFGAGATDGDIVLFAPTNAAHVSFSSQRTQETSASVRAPVRRLSTIMRDLGHHRLDLVKMDIEGAEYEVIDAMLDDGILPRQLLVEFHHRFVANGPARTTNTIAALERFDYSIVAISDTGEEFTFLRSAR